MISVHPKFILLEIKVMVEAGVATLFKQTPDRVQLHLA
jgi:hypothetical protein